MPQTDSPVAIRRYERGSNDLPLGAFAESHKLLSGDSSVNSMMPKLQTSFSTPDIPTLRNATASTIRGTPFERHRRELSNGIDSTPAVCNWLMLLYDFADVHHAT